MTQLIIYLAQASVTFAVSFYASVKLYNVTPPQITQRLEAFR